MIVSWALWMKKLNRQKFIIIQLIYARIDKLCKRAEETNTIKWETTFYRDIDTLLISDDVTIWRRFVENSTFEQCLKSWTCGVSSHSVFIYLVYNIKEKHLCIKYILLYKLLFKTPWVTQLHSRWQRQEYKWQQKN